jgi:hypothetical protein
MQPTPAPEAASDLAPWERPYRPQPTQPTPAPEPEPEPALALGAQPGGGLPVDAVTKAEQVLAEADAAFSEVREHHVHCRIAYLALQPMYREDNGKKLVVGALQAGDEIFTAVLADLQASKRDYDHHWQRRAQAQDQLAQAVKLYRRGVQETYVLRHQPHLVQAVEHWADRLRCAASDWQHSEAKKNHAEAMMAWQTAVLTAPVSSNGIPH